MLVHNVGSTERNHGWFLDDSLDVDREDDRGQLRRDGQARGTRTREGCGTVAGAGSSSWAR